MTIEYLKFEGSSLIKHLEKIKDNGEECEVGFSGSFVTNPIRVSFGRAFVNKNGKIECVHDDVQEIKM